VETPSLRGSMVRLIESDDERPKVALTPGKRYEVIATSVVDSDLNDVTDEMEGPALRPPRLCGSGSTCLAIVEIE